MAFSRNFELSMSFVRSGDTQCLAIVQITQGYTLLKRALPILLLRPLVLVVSCTKTLFQSPCLFLSIPYSHYYPDPAPVHQLVDIEVKT